MPISFKKFTVKEERTSIPTPRQFRVGHNPSYLNSLMCGVFSPILHIPQILWFNSLWPFIKSLAMGLSFIGLSIVAGVMGRANGFVITDVEDGELTEDEKFKALSDMLEGTGYKAVPVNQPMADFGATGQH
jgi:hypothetical protein